MDGLLLWVRSTRTEKEALAHEILMRPRDAGLNVLLNRTFREERTIFRSIRCLPDPGSVMTAGTAIARPCVQDLSQDLSPSIQHETFCRPPRALRHLRAD